MDSALLLPMFAHLAWTAMLYALVTVLRAPKVWGVGLRRDNLSPFALMEPKASANLSNQFEWPLFFYVICIILILKPEWMNADYILLAWVFVLGRFIHSLVQILTSNVRMRGLVFTINFLAVIAMWIRLLVETIIA